MSRSGCWSAGKCSSIQILVVERDVRPKEVGCAGPDEAGEKGRTSPRLRNLVATKWDLTRAVHAHLTALHKK